MENVKRSLTPDTYESVHRQDKEENPTVRRRLTDGIKRRRSNSGKRKPYNEFLRQSSTDVLPPLDNIETFSSENSENLEVEVGYRSDTSDNGNDLESVQQQQQIEEPIQNNTPTSSPSTPEPGVTTRIKRTLSGKFRSSSSNKVNEQTTPHVDDTIHKSISQSMSGKAFSKLLKKTSHIDQIDAKGQSLLHICSSRGLLDCIRVLLKKGSNINLQDNKGYSPLHCAAIEKRLDCFQFLLESKGIDVTLSNNENSNVLHYLVRITVDESNLVIFRQILDALVEKGINFNQENNYKEAPIHFACFKSNTHAVAFLLERGADCNLRTS